MTAKKFSDALGNISANYINEAINYSAAKNKKTWVKWGMSVAACLCLITLLAVNVLDRFEIFEESCSANIGTAVDGVYYFEITHDGIYSYDESGGVKKLLSTFWYDRWDVNEYGVYYNRGTKLYVLPHGSSSSVKLYSSAKGSRTDFSIQPDGNISVSTLGKADGKIQIIKSFCIDGITGDMINREATDTVYEIGNRVITHVEREDGCDLLENEISILPEGITVGYGAEIFDDGGIFYVHTADANSWTLFIASANGNDNILTINGDPPFALTDRYVIYVNDNALWCTDIESEGSWELQTDSDEFEVYEFVLADDKLYTCVPWSERQSYWKIIIDTVGKPISLSLINEDITE